MTFRLDPGVRLLPAGPDRNPVSRSGVELVYPANSFVVAVGSDICPLKSLALPDNPSAHFPGVAFEPAPPVVVVVRLFRAISSRFDPGAPLLRAGPDIDPVPHSGVEPVYAANSVRIAVSFVSFPRPAFSLSYNSSACDPVLAFVPASPNIVVIFRSDPTPMPVGPIVGAPCQLATAVRSMTRQQLRGDWNAYPLLPLFRQTYAFAYGLACGPPALSTRVVRDDRCAVLTPRMSPRSLTWCRAGSNYNGRHWHHAGFHGRSPPCSSFWPRIRQHWPLFLPPPAASQNHRSPCGSALLARSSKLRVPHPVGRPIVYRIPSRNATNAAPLGPRYALGLPTVAERKHDNKKKQDGICMQIRIAIGGGSLLSRKEVK